MKEFKVIVSSKINNKIDQILTDNNKNSQKKTQGKIHSSLKKYFEQSQVGTTKQWESFSQIKF